MVYRKSPVYYYWWIFVLLYLSCLLIIGALKDPVYPVTVQLHYESYYKEDVIKAWLVIRQEETKPVTLTRLAFADDRLGTRNDRYRSPFFFLTLNKKS